VDAHGPVRQDGNALQHPELVDRLADLRIENAVERGPDLFLGDHRSQIILFPTVRIGRTRR
jgi:hypothetical protein